MMWVLLKVLAVTAACTPFVNAASPGASIAVTQKAVDYLNYDVFTPKIKKTLGKLKLKDYKTTVKGVSVKVSEIHTYAFDCDNCFEFSIHDSSISVGTKAFSIRVGAKFSYKWKIIKGHGSCGLKMKTGSLGYNLTLGVDNGHPTISTKDVKASLHDISVGCSGIAGAVINVITFIFKGKIMDKLKSAIKDELVSISQQASKAMYKIPLSIPIDDYALMQYDLVQKPVLGKVIAVGVAGACVPIKNKNLTIPYPLAKMPVYDSSQDSYVQLGLTSYTINSIAYTYFVGGYEKGVVQNTAIPASFPIQLNTHNLAVKLVAPHIEEYYPNMTMRIKYGAKDKPWVNITKDGVKVVVPFTFDFQVHVKNGTAEAFTFFCPLTLASSITFTSTQRIAANLTLLSCHLTLMQSKVGDISDKLVATLTDFSIEKIILPIANKVLNVGFPIPATDQFALTSTKIIFYDGYFNLASKFTVKFKESALPLGPSTYGVSEPLPFKDAEYRELERLTTSEEEARESGIGEEEKKGEREKEEEMEKAEKVEMGQVQKSSIRRRHV